MKTNKILSVLFLVLATTGVTYAQEPQIDTTEDFTIEEVQSFDTSYEDAVEDAFSHVNPLVWENYSELSDEDIDRLYETLEEMVNYKLTTIFYE